jgi:hypothetical protein
MVVFLRGDRRAMVVKSIGSLDGAYNSNAAHMYMSGKSAPDGRRCSNQTGSDAITLYRILTHLYHCIALILITGLAAATPHCLPGQTNEGQGTVGTHRTEIKRRGASTSTSI